MLLLGRHSGSPLCLSWLPELVVFSVGFDDPHEIRNGDISMEGYFARRVVGRIVP